MQPANYTLCYYDSRFVGFNYTNAAGGQKLEVNFAESVGYTSGANGQTRIGAWHYRNTAGDLNTMVTILVNGSPFSTTRWGDAPPC